MAATAAATAAAAEAEEGVDWEEASGAAAGGVAEVEEAGMEAVARVGLVEWTVDELAAAAATTVRVAAVMAVAAAKGAGSVAVERRAPPQQPAPQSGPVRCSPRLRPMSS